MPEGSWLAIAFVASAIGMGWFALAFDTHWQQVHGRAALRDSTRRILRGLGALALAFSFTACFFADHPTMAPLVWVMSLAVSAALIAMILAWRPRLLAVLAPASR